MITRPGLYDEIPEAAYHLDPVEPGPSLSSSIAKLLVTRSPRHAAFEHPKINRAKALDVEAPTKAMDIGTAAHKLILGRGRDIAEIAAADYRTNAAKAARDAARAAGRVPILSDDMATIKLLAEAARDQIAGTELAGIFDDGAAEVTGVWQDLGGIWCRMRLDWLPDAARDGGHITVVDLKTTGGSGHPDDWQRTAFDMGYDFQEAHYRRGLLRLIPNVREIKFVFAVLEQDPPYGLALNVFSRQAREEAAILIDLAHGLWGECLRRNEWPGYPTETTHIDPPKYRSDRAEIRRLALLRRAEIWQGIGAKRQPDLITTAAN
jgi:hypothetical protein